MPDLSQQPEDRQARSGDPSMVGCVRDRDGRDIYLGTDQGTVTISTPISAVVLRLEAHQAEEFARLFVAACWEAATMPP